MNTYTTLQGDTWDIIAKRAYGNEKSADVLMSNNTSLLDIFIFPAGVSISIPKIEIEHNADILPPWR